MMAAMLTVLSLLLHMATAQAADPIGTIGGARDLPGEHRVSLGISGGASFLVGGQGAAFGPGPAAGLLMDVPFSEYAGFAVNIGYASHRVVDANGLFDPESMIAPLDPDNVTGTQHHLHAELGLRVDLAMSDPTRSHRQRVQVAPWLRFAVGLSMTDTLLEVASMGGREPVRTRSPHVLLCPALGLAIRLPRLLTIRPGFQSVTMLGIDHDEVTNTDSLRSVFRLQPSLDLLFRF
jgi:hypothetical protein